MYCWNSKIVSHLLVNEKCKFNKNNKFNLLIYGFIHTYSYDCINIIPESLYLLILSFYLSSDIQILKDICWSFSYLTDFDNEYEYNNCADKRIEISLTEINNSQTIRAIVRSIGNSVAISDEIMRNGECNGKYS